MSLVISAFNEAAVIRRKLENALSLDYPPGLLEIVVVSDASDDGTDAIVSEYAGRGVVLHRQPERRGKTAGLNRTVPLLTGEVVVFSDANAMYEPDCAAEARAELRGSGGWVRHRRGTLPPWLRCDGRGRRARVLGLRDPDQAARNRPGIDGRRRWRHLRHPPIALARPARGCHQRLLEPVADCGGRPAGCVRAGGCLLRRNCWGDAHRVSTPCPYRQPKLACCVPGARGAQSIPSRLVRMVVGFPQDVAVGRWCGSRFSRSQALLACTSRRSHGGRLHRSASRCLPAWCHRNTNGPARGCHVGVLRRYQCRIPGWRGERIVGTRLGCLVHPAPGLGKPQEIGCFPRHACWALVPDDKRDRRSSGRAWGGSRGRVRTRSQTVVLGLVSRARLRLPRLSGSFGDPREGRDTASDP